MDEEENKGITASLEVKQYDLDVNEDEDIKTTAIITTLVFVTVSPFSVVAAVDAVNEYGVFLAFPFILIAIICFVGVFIGIHLNIKLLRK